MKNIHQVNGNMEDLAQNQKYKCAHCRASYDSESDLSAHVSNVHSEVKCDSCDEKFIGEGALKKHAYKAHGKTAPKEFSCEACGSTFTQSGSLKQHYKVAHEGILEHKCEFCGKMFGYKNNLMDHIKGNFQVNSFWFSIMFTF